MKVGLSNDPKFVKRRKNNKMINYEITKIKLDDRVTLYNWLSFKLSAFTNFFLQLIRSLSKKNSTK